MTAAAELWTQIARVQRLRLVTTVQVPGRAPRVVLVFRQRTTRLAQAFLRVGIARPLSTVAVTAAIVAAAL